MIGFFPTVDKLGLLTSIQGIYARKQGEIDHVKASIRILCDTEDQYNQAIEEITRVNEGSLGSTWLSTAKRWVDNKAGGYYGKG